jgi:hypothetical protein
MRGYELADIVAGTPPPPATTWSATNLPSTVPAGENIRDNMPSGVPIYTASTFSSSADIPTLLQAIDSAVSSPGYVYLGTSDRVIGALGPIGTNAWYGYANSSRHIMGLIGDGADKTSISEGPNMLPSAARSYALAPSDTSGPVPIYDLEFSNTNSSVPLFFSGITFKGQFQGPYGVPASSGLSVNTSVASPLAHRGLALNKAIPGSRVQFCRFLGFAYAIKASPPYELSGLETNNDNGTVIYRIEIDGRVPGGGVSAGGYMTNYATNLTVKDSWLHDTRRSGFALHESTGAGNHGTYTVSNFQVERIASASDGFAGSGLGFNASNVEEMSGTITYAGDRFALDRGYHIALGTTNGGVLAQAINVADFTSLSSSYNGCLVMRIIGTPNGSGNSPYESLYQSGGLSALPFHVTNKGVTLTPVASGSFNAATMTPADHYVVVTS